MNKLIKPAKKALAKKYGYSNVSVKNGTGTAWGWVEVSITTTKPAVECLGDEEYRMCSNCREAYSSITKEARAIMEEAWKAEGLTANTYTSDDGYGTERDEVLIDVTYI